MLNKILGSNPKTSLLGIAIAALGIIHVSMQAGQAIDWMAVVNSILMGVLGLKASDGSAK